MKKYYLGIDLGTSSVKGMVRSAEGDTKKGRAVYGNCENGVVGAWLSAIREMIAELCCGLDGEIAALSLSSQVGTYIVDGETVIDWRSSAGKEELGELRAVISQKEFIDGIGMAHPDIISYPLPRLMYIRKNHPDARDVIMPKELIIRELTGNTVTDVFSMRGIADPKSGRYAEGIIQKLSLSVSLPELKRPTDIGGYVTRKAAEKYGLPCGIPVYLGCNDFFAGLIGMGVYDENTAFDLSGTSEHVGIISKERIADGFVSGAYFNRYCTYGGTKSSGESCAFAMSNFGLDELRKEDIKTVLDERPPIFLPYLSGERAPIFDENAKGVYFGIGRDTNKKHMAYSALEGVVFSLIDIWRSMGGSAADKMICGGGSAKDPLMNMLRAELFDCPVYSVTENDTSALGAAMIAMVADGVYKDIPEAIKNNVTYHSAVYPSGRYKEKLEKRFFVYKKLYSDLSEEFAEFNKI